MTCSGEIGREPPCLSTTFNRLDCLTQQTDTPADAGYGSGRKPPVSQPIAPSPNPNIWHDCTKSMPWPYEVVEVSGMRIADPAIVMCDGLGYWHIRTDRGFEKMRDEQDVPTHWRVIDVS